VSTLSALDAALAADPGLPHRDLLLDPDASAHRLRALAARGAADVRVRTLRVRYQPGHSLRVTQSVSPSGTSAAPDGSGAPVAVVSTRGVPADSFHRLAGSSGASTRPGSRVTADAATSSVSWLFPQDRRLTALPSVWGRTGAVRHALGPAWTVTELAALAPEKAATLRCRAEAGTGTGTGTGMGTGTATGTGRVLAYAKVYATAEAAAGAADRVERAGGLTAGPGSGAAGLVPTVLAVVPEQCTVLLSEVRGEPLSALPPDRLGPALEAMATTLARLHAVDPGPLPPQRRFTPAALAAAAEAVAVARPELGALAHDVAADLAGTVPIGPVVLVHGDAHLPNALLGESGVGLIDLDEASSGHPAADVAGVLAGLRRARLTGTLTPRGEADLGARFVAAYAAVAGPLDPGALTWHVAAALLVEGAARGVRRLQPATLPLLVPLLTEAMNRRLPW
jgi:aminoglycoside phosphotransferase